MNKRLDQIMDRNLIAPFKHQYQFWETQPVPRLDEEPLTSEPIEPNKPIEEIRSEPYNLPDGFEWVTVDLNDDVVLRELYTLLNENYVEDDDSMFRFDYSPKFLRWALQPPGWRLEWHCGVRVSKSNKLVGFIGATPAKIKIVSGDQKRVADMVEINFLCVHKKLRSKRMTPVLIREITRRVNRAGIFQAIFTAGVVIPKPIAKCRYYHRSINPKKLIEVRFSSLTKNMTMKRALKLYSLPETTRLEGFKELEKKHLPQVFDMLTDYLNKFDLTPQFSLEEVEHWFMPQPEVVNSYVVERDDKVLAFTSFYTLPSTVISHPTHSSIKAAYSFYNYTTKPITFVELIRDALVMAKKLNYDVFNALDLMENKQFLEELKFGIGDGDLQYYLYNWKCPTYRPEQIGLVLQ
uniref:Glycylpeptide N-tetradecanoyltransferase n=1 Tax=Aceria tosichella TaxID=561515 RepID=A0A6G1SPN7_9ACAR